MDWRVFLTTFGVIFLAEMGDKTQLAAMTMAAQSKSPGPCSSPQRSPLTAVSAIGVLAGSVLGNYLPLDWIKRVAAGGLYRHWRVDAGRQVLSVGQTFQSVEPKEIFHLSFDISHLSFRAARPSPFMTRRSMILACGY